MSRIGKLPILIPQNVEIKIEGQKITAKGPKGELSRQILPEIEICQKEEKLLLSPRTKSKRANSYWGLERVLVKNIVQGVSEGYEKRLEVVGVGYKIRVEGQDLILDVGFTHTVKVEPYENMKFSVEGNVIVVSGIDKEKVGQMAAKIRRVKRPDAYKGKGIRYFGEEIKLKPGKKAVASGGGGGG